MTAADIATEYATREEAVFALPRSERAAAMAALDSWHSAALTALCDAKVAESCDRNARAIVASWSK